MGGIGSKSQILLPDREREGTSAPLRCRSCLGARPKPCTIRLPCISSGCASLNTAFSKHVSCPPPAEAPPRGGGAGRDHPAPAALFLPGPPFSRLERPSAAALFQSPFSCPDRPFPGAACAVPALRTPPPVGGGAGAGPPRCAPRAGSVGSVGSVAESGVRLTKQYRRIVRAW